MYHLIQQPSLKVKKRLEPVFDLLATPFVYYLFTLLTVIEQEGGHKPYSLMFICIPQYVFPSNSFRYQLIPLAWRQTSVSFITPSPDQSGLHGRVLLSLKADMHETLETGCRTVLPLKKYKKTDNSLIFSSRLLEVYAQIFIHALCNFLVSVIFFWFERLIWVDSL